MVKANRDQLIEKMIIKHSYINKPPCIIQSNINKKEKEKWQRRVQQCEEDYWRSRLGKPLEY